MIDFPKYWQHSKFDKEGNEISYQSNHGLEYRLDGYNLISFKNYDIEIDQESLNDLSVKPNNKIEKELLLAVDKSKLVGLFDVYNSIIFFKDNMLIMEYCYTDRSLFLWDKIFVPIVGGDFELIKFFLNKLFKINITRINMVDYNCVGYDLQYVIERSKIK